MGRAIVRDPEVFLFDEPLSNLDAKLRVQMRKEIKELHQRLKTTTIFVTHDQDEAMTMADRIVVMNDGNVEQIGTPLDLYDRPDNLFVATFIGSPAMNLLNGIYDSSSSCFVSAGGASLQLEAEVKAENGQSIVIGVRPEHLEISTQGIETSVSVIEPTGTETLVFAKHGEEELVAMFRDRHAFSSGESVTLAPREGTIHVFDTESGNCIQFDGQE